MIDRENLPTAAWRTFSNAWIVVLVGAVAAAIWLAREAVLLAFASVVVATALVALARPIERTTRLSRRWSLPLSGLMFVLVIGAFGWIAGSDLKSQLVSLQRSIPDAIASLQSRLRDVLEVTNTAPRPQAGDATTGSAPPAGGPRPPLPDVSGVLIPLLGNLAAAGSMIFDALASLFVVIAGAMFLAADPGRYRAGLVLLAPPRHRSKLDEALLVAGSSLHAWVVGQALSMTIVGALVGIGAWAIGLEAPLALGLFAGLAEIVPVVGPVVGALPVVLTALVAGPQQLALALLLLLVVQQAESNVITPFVQESMTSVPGFLLLLATVALGLIFGLVGVLLAAPLCVVLYVLVSKLYIERTLGIDVELPAEKDAER